jgi:peptidoglycan DL-endopeptidase CwlO
VQALSAEHITGGPVAARDGVARRWRAGSAALAGVVMTLAAPAGRAGAAAVPPTFSTPAPSKPASGAPATGAPAWGRTLTYNEGAAGFCTWWAIQQFHAYTGVYPDFYDPANDGNAGYWATDAAYDGWTVTPAPRAASIAVFPPGVDGADAEGHVAWVTSVSGQQIVISEMNGLAGWGQVDTRELTPGSAVRYIPAP